MAKWLKDSVKAILQREGTLNQLAIKRAEIQAHLQDVGDAIAPDILFCLKSFDLRPQNHYLYHKKQ